ncbi:MAG: hypothetical protein ACRC8Y_00890 [Chroococcales cyanobacterium]
MSVSLTHLERIWNHSTPLSHHHPIFITKALHHPQFVVTTSVVLPLSS